MRSESEAFRVGGTKGDNTPHSLKAFGFSRSSPSRGEEKKISK